MWATWKILKTLSIIGAKTKSNEMAVTMNDFSSKWGPDVFSLNGKISLLHYISKIKNLPCYEKINSSKVSTSSLYYVSFTIYM